MYFHRDWSCHQKSFTHHSLRTWRWMMQPKKWFSFMWVFFFNCLSDCTYCSGNILQHLDRSPIPFLFISYKSSVHMFWANLNVLFCFSLTMKNHRRTRAPRSRPNLLQMKNPVSKQTRMRNYPSGELARQSGSGLGHVTWKSDSGSSRERLEWRPRIHGSTSKESTRMVESL